MRFVQVGSVDRAAFVDFQPVLYAICAETVANLVLEIMQARFFLALFNTGQIEMLKKSW
jgi:hypothetical protein